jgi:mannose-6-phosphate isomerase-like protein (cupin superfamily)
LHDDGEAAFFIPAQTECRVEAGVGALFLEMFLTPGSPAGRAIQFSLAPTELQGKGFAWKSLIDRSKGSTSVRANLVQVQPGAGSPDRHIHLFDQFYLVLEGEMRVEVGRREMDAGPLSFVVLPAGCVHRNWNASKKLERHIAFLVPEPVEGQIFDYAVDVHEREAELMGPL